MTGECYCVKEPKYPQENCKHLFMGSWVVIEPGKTWRRTCILCGQDEFTSEQPIEPKNKGVSK